VRDDVDLVEPVLPRQPQQERVQACSAVVDRPHGVDRHVRGQHDRDLVEALPPCVPDDRLAAQARRCGEHRQTRVEEVPPDRGQGVAGLESLRGRGLRGGVRRDRRAARDEHDGSAH